MVIPWSDRPDCNALCDLEASTMNGFDTFFWVTFCFLSLRNFFWHCWSASSAASSFLVITSFAHRIWGSTKSWIRHIGKSEFLLLMHRVWSFCTWVWVDLVCGSTFVLRFHAYRVFESRFVPLGWFFSPIFFTDQIISAARDHRKLTNLCVQQLGLS